MLTCVHLLPLLIPITSKLGSTSNLILCLFLGPHRGKKYKEADKDMKTTVSAPGLWTCQQKYAIFTGNNSLHPNLPVKRRAVAEIQVIVFVLQDKEVLDHIKNVEAKEQFVMDLLEEVVGRA